MKITHLLALVLVVVLLVSGCVGGAPDPKNPSVFAEKPEVGTKASGIVEYGNFSYVPINRSGLPEANIEYIGAAISLWEEAFPTREIVDIDYFYMQNTYSGDTDNYTYGVAVISRQKDS